MAVVWNSARGFACLALALGGCGREAIESASYCDGLAPGDLVITEVHANPDGTDGESEYLELFNASAAPLALDGLTLVSSRTDGAGSKSHRLLSASIDAADYLVLGNAPSDAMPAHVDYSYGEALGSLRNTEALVSIWCAQTLIDEVSYAATSDGRALELDGRLTPHHESNDQAAHWCAAPASAAESFPKNFGTPGAPNSPCEAQSTVSTCLDGELRRAIDLPRPGGVRITEWMANPDGADTELEWVEALFSVDADLNGFELGPAPDALRVVVQQEDCFPVGAGERVVFGASPAAAPRVDAELGFSLGNSGTRSVLAGVDGAVLDRVDYDGTVEGIAWQLDLREELCLSAIENEYAPGNSGTPGEPNPSCPLLLSPGECFDEGVPRQIMSPRPGEAQITEWMANPAAVGNREGEWVEVRFSAAVDLNGLLLSDLTAGAKPFDHPACLSVPAGAHRIFARNANPLENGGLEAVDGQLSISLNNSRETLSLSIDGEVLDTVAYERSAAGVATQVDEFGKVCDAAHPYGDGDLGTPGLANPWCP